MINEKCREMVNNLGGNDSVRQAFTELFDAMTSDADMQDLPSATLVLQFYDETCGLKAGDWAPEIHLVIQKVTDEHSNDTSTSTSEPDSSSGEQVDEGTAE